MPRPRLTEQQQRAMADMDLPHDMDVAQVLGLGKTVYSKRKQDPYHGFGFDRASQLARQLQFTGREVCKIMGVPYAPEAGE